MTDGLLLRALTGMLTSGDRAAPLPATVLRLAYRLTDDPAADPNSGNRLRDAIARQHNCPDDIRADLLNRISRGLDGSIEALLENPGTPPQMRTHVIHAVTTPSILGPLAESSPDPVVLAAIAARVAQVPRATTTAKGQRRRRGWVSAATGELVAAVGLQWERVAALLLGNPHLELSVGRTVVRALLAHLDADLAELDDHVDDGYGDGSLIWRGISAWLSGRDRDLGWELAATRGHRWLLALAAGWLPEKGTLDVDSAVGDLAGSVLREVILPDLLTGPTGAESGPQQVPARVSVVILAVFDRLTAAEQQQIRDLLADPRRWDLVRSPTGLRRLWQPDDGHVSPVDGLTQLCTYGAAARVRSEIAAALAGGRSIGAQALAAFAIRTDFAAAEILELTLAAGMAVPTLLALRPDLRTALPKAIAQDPWPARAIATILTGTGDVTGDVDLALASVEAFAGRVAAGGPAPESVRNLVRMLLPRLGSHTRQLSWPVLANCTGLDGDLDRYVAAQLDIALAGGDAEKVLVQLAEAATGDLEELIAATVEIFTPARTMSTSTGRS